jgi:hypothetical protein
MTLKLAVAGAGSFAAVAGGAPVALAQPAVSAASTVIGASVVASHRGAVMTIRRVPDRLGSGCRCAGKPVLLSGLSAHARVRAVAQATSGGRKRS